VEKGDLSNFGRGYVDVCLAGRPSTQTATLLGVERDSFWGYVGIQKPWEDNISKEEHLTLYIEKA
jgi:hypothetical protein